MASLTENNDLLLTPFERNLEVWRQLWRVVERCDLVVQIVDARNPLFLDPLIWKSTLIASTKPMTQIIKRGICYLLIRQIC